MPLYNPPTTWQTLYFLDFTAQSNLNIKTAGSPVTIDGRSWTSVNMGSATSFQIINGTGLSINPAANSGSGNPTARACPLITIPLTNLLPATLNVTRHIIRAVVRVQLTGASVASQGIRAGWELGSAPLTQAWSLFRGFSTLSTGGGGGGQQEMGVQESVLSALPAGVTSFATSTGATDDVYGLFWDPSNRFELRTDVFSSGVPTAIQVFRYANIQNLKNFAVNTTTPNFDVESKFQLQADMNLMLGAQDSAPSGGGSFTGVFTHLRIDMSPKYSV